MAKDDSEKLFWVFSEIEEGVHTGLMEVCTSLGKHPREIIARAIEEYILRWVAERKTLGKNIPSAVELESIMLTERKRQVAEGHLKILAYNYQQYPTDEGLEILMRACSLSNVSVEMVMERTAGNTHILEIIDEKGSLSIVETWLAETMKPGERYHSSEILEMGNKFGYKDYVIKEAKRALGIQSQRHGNKWVWVMPLSEKSAF